MDISLFKKLGFSDKTARVYLALLCLGPSSVRNLAKKTEMNRGTVYDSLKWLKEIGLVTYYEKEAKQYFVAEDPSKLYDLLDRKSKEMNDLKEKLSDTVSELRSVYDKGGERPVSRYYEKEEIRKILEDVLEQCEKSPGKEYRVYSDVNLREYLYESFETYSVQRIARGIKVKVFAIGAGGELRGLDERKWLDVKPSTPTYIIIYPGNTAYISLNAQGEPFGVVIENDGIYEVQKAIFDSLWDKI